MPFTNREFIIEECKQSKYEGTAPIPKHSYSHRSLRAISRLKGERYFLRPCYYSMITCIKHASALKLFSNSTGTLERANLVT
jgi:hypothetical protein